MQLRTFSAQTPFRGKQRMPNIRTAKPHVSRLYRIGTFAFLAVALAAAGAIVFVAFTSTTITITRGTHELSSASIITASEHPKTDSEELPGALLAATIDGSRTQDVPQTGTMVDDYAHGTVTIKNSWTKPQPLAAKTRLRASSNGIIYRTTSRVDVPTGGSVAVDVIADTAGEKGNIGADRFEIVALWPGLKDTIYGTSTEPMTGGVRASSQLSQATIDEAKRALEEELLNRSSETQLAGPGTHTFLPKPFLLTSNITTAAKAGDTVPSVTVKGSIRVIFIGIDSVALQKKTAALVASMLSDDERSRDAEPELSYRLLDVSEKNGTAQIEVTCTVTAELSTASERFSPSRFTRKTSDEIRNVLLGTNGVTDVDVLISPFWSMRSASAPSRIKIVFAK
ncbi:MAG: hypothetical protein V1907_02470 [Candidatus Kerfeldbacteria bacterium]